MLLKKSYTINKNPTLYVKGKKITKKNLIKKIYILKNKNRFRISNNEMKKLNIRTIIDISNGIKKTLIELERNNNRLK